MKFGSDESIIESTRLVRAAGDLQLMKLTGDAEYEHAQADFQRILERRIEREFRERFMEVLFGTRD